MSGFFFLTDPKLSHNQSHSVTESLKVLQAEIEDMSLNGDEKMISLLGRMSQVLKNLVVDKVSAEKKAGIGDTRNAENGEEAEFARES